MAGWTSAKTPHTVRGLELEKEYTLTERRAPDGYTEAESIVFKLTQTSDDQSNEIYVKSDDGWSKTSHSAVIMQDIPALCVEKTDVADNLLPGAALTVRDTDGKTIDTWVTDYKPHKVPISDGYLKLSDEEAEYIYTLTEDAAPAGFEIASSVQFKLETVHDTIYLFVRKNENSAWSRADERLIRMVDEAMPRKDTPTQTPAPTPKPTPAATTAPTPSATPAIRAIPQTKDGFPLIAVGVIALASAAGLVLLVLKRKKSSGKKEDAHESIDR